MWPKRLLRCVAPRYHTKRMGKRRHSGRLVAAAVFLIAQAFGCTSLGEGSGVVHSDLLRATPCWDGPFDLNPNFFAGVPYRDSLQIRVQRGGDLVEVSDGLSVLVSDVKDIRGNTGAGKLGTPLDVGLPPEVTPPGVPIRPTNNPPLVHMALYLHRTCHATNIALYATSGTITFDKLFNGDRNETDPGETLTSASFDVMAGDPRDQPPAGGQIPDDKLSRIVGRFQFYFQRGQPAQPFP